jgi:hypothetical protein
VLISEKIAISITTLPFHNDPPKMTSKKKIFEPVSKMVDYVLGRGENRFKSGAYTLVCGYFESVFNNAYGR